MEKPKGNYSELWMVIAFIIAIWFGIYAHNDTKRMLNAIRTHNLDTLSFNDTTYVIKAKIDTIYYDPEEREPPEHN